MKKQKLTPEEKKEIRKENSSWKKFIRITKKKGALIEESVIENGVEKIIWQQEGLG